MNGSTGLAHDERGSGSGLGLAVVAVLALVATVVAVMGLGAVQLSRARSAADLVALSGARAFADGGEACEAAEATARANEVALDSCELAGDAFGFVVSVRVELALGLDVPAAPPTLSATAHAGSAELGAGRVSDGQAPGGAGDGG